MKKLLIALLILLAVSCKKETPVPPANNPTPATIHENYIIAEGDTLQLLHLLSANVTGGNVMISGYDTTDYYLSGQINHSMVFGEVPLVVGTDTLSYNSNNTASLFIGAVNYDTGVLSFTISSIGPVGGYVTGYYSGTMKIGNPPTTVINVSGKFSVVRN